MSRFLLIIFYACPDLSVRAFFRIANEIPALESRDSSIQVARAHFLYCTSTFVLSFFLVIIVRL
ncbi:hypothetical protein BYT27DRAFT_7192232 [Phlegmacium glaucopus]|nr:hypothetical protein BYT27DRAFT_7192232 [Phlegmacium glaucopus]